MKKFLGISIVAMLAVTPLAASADVATVGTNDATVGVASTKYVKEAYNAMAGAVNTELAKKQNTITSDAKLNADLVDDSSSTNKFVTAEEKASWTAKQGALTASQGIDITNNTVKVDTGDGLEFDGNGNDAKLTINTGSGLAINSTSKAVEVSGITTSNIASDAGITGSQLSATAGITGSQLAANAGITGSQLAANAGITGSQLSATAGITGSQLAANAGIVGTQLSSDVQISLGKADSAVQSVAEGATNGTIAVDGTDVAVHGLGSAAYTSADAYATATQGGKADQAATDIGTMANLETTATNLVAAINEVKGTADNAANEDLSNLTATGKANVSAQGTYASATNYTAGTVGAAIKANETSIGTLSSLTTTEKGSLVGAINEVDGNVDTLSGEVGTLTNLTTSAKSNLVGAINEVNARVLTIYNGWNSGSTPQTTSEVTLGAPTPANP